MDVAIETHRGDEPSTVLKHAEISVFNAMGDVLCFFL